MIQYCYLRYQSVFEKCFLTYVPKGYDTSYPLGYASQFVP